MWEDVAGECRAGKETLQGGGRVSAGENRPRKAVVRAGAEDSTREDRPREGRRAQKLGKDTGRQGQREAGEATPGQGGIGVARACVGVTPLAPGLKVFRDVIAVIKIYRS